MNHSQTNDITPKQLSTIIELLIFDSLLLFLSVNIIGTSKAKILQSHILFQLKRITYKSIY
jgi:hypothetical protein